MESLKVEIETPQITEQIKDIRRLSKEFRNLHNEMRQMQSERARFQTNHKDLPTGNAHSDITRPSASSRAAAKEAASVARGSLNLESSLEKAAAAAGEFGTPIALAAAAVWELHKASLAASAEMRQFRVAQLESGGTAYEVAQGGTIGRYLGLEGKDVARQARQFSERITSDPEAMATAQRYGINDTPGTMGGRLNKMDNLLRFIDKMRDMSDSEATRAARATGTEDYLPLRDLTARNYQILKQMARAEGAQNSPEALIKNANEELGRHVLNEGFRDIYHGMGRAFGDDLRGIGRHLIPGMDAAGRQEDAEVAEHTRRRQGQGTGPGSGLDRHTTALEQNNAHLDTLNSYLRAGLYGGGERARGAIPGAYIGAGWASRQLRQTSMALGAFSL